MNVKYPEEYAIFDFETTGLDPRTSKIIEFAVKRHDDPKPISMLIKWPELQISDTTTEITGITQELIDKEGVDPKTALAEFTSLTRGRQIIGHNVHNFDIPFLLMWITSLPSLRSVQDHYDWYSHNYLDTAALYRGWKLREGQKYNEDFATYAKRIFALKTFSIKYSLGYCCQEFKIKMDQQQHRAEGDVILTERLYLKLLDL